MARSPVIVGASSANVRSWHASSDWRSTEMSDVVGDATDLQHVGAPQSGQPQPTRRNEDLPESLQLILLSLQSVEAAKERFPDYRLTRLVSARLELDERDVTRLTNILGVDPPCPDPGVLQPFNDHLRGLIARYHLKALFSDDGHAPYHHAIRPTGYDFSRDEVSPTGMER